MERKNKVFFKAILVVTGILFFSFGLNAQGWSTENPNYTIYNGGPDLDMVNVPSYTCVGNACGCDASGNFYEYSHAYSGSGVSISSDKLTANFTGNKTISARVTETEYRSQVDLNNGGFRCTYVGASTSTDHSFTVTGQNFAWTGSIPDRCTAGGTNQGSVNLYSYFSLSSGVSFSGPGVSGSTWNPSGLSAGNKTITATKTYDNGTASVTTTVTVYAQPTVTFTNPPAFCSSDSDPNLDSWSNVNGTYSSATATLGGTRNRNIIMSSTPAGTHTITVTYTNGNGCTQTDNATITINAQNTVDAGANQEECKDSGLVNLTASTSGVSWSCVGCSYVSNGKFDTNSAPAGVYTVRATKSSGACSDTDDKTFTVKGLPSVNAGNNVTVCIDEGTLTLNGNSPSTGTWSGPSVSGNSMNLASAGAGSHIVTFSHTNAAGCTNTDTRTINIIALPNANSISVSGDDRCGAGSVSLSASLSGHTIKWYSSSSGGSALRTGNTYSPSVSVGTTNFWVEAINSNDCVSSGRKKVTAVAYPIPAAPIASDNDRCGPGSVTLTASSPIGSPVFDWFENPTGGSSLHTGASYATPSLSSTRSYYVEVTSTDNCKSSSRTEVQAIINTIPGGPTVTNDDRCGSGSVTLTAAGAPAGGDYNWYTTDSGGSPFDNGSTLNVSLSSTTSYWVSIVSAEGCEGSRVEVIGTVYSEPSAPSVTPNDRCGSGTLTLSASGAAGSTFNWYDTQASVVSLHEGGSYSPSISNTRSYWVEITNANGCISPRTEVVGTIHPIPNDPSASNEVRCGPGPVTLTASGSGAGAIYNWYENSTGGSILETGPSFTTPSLTSSKTYYVQGVSDQGCESVGRTAVLAEIFSIPSTPTVFPDDNCGSGIVSLSVGGAPAGGDYLWYESEGSSTVINSGNSYDVALTGTTSFWVSIISQEGCEGEREEIVGTINEIPEKPTGTSGERCGSGQVNVSAIASVTGTFKWYTTDVSETIIATGPTYTTPSLTSTKTYWVEIEDENGCVSERTEVTATIHPLPTEPNVPNENRCGPGSVTLTASGSGTGAVYDWYTSGTGGSPIHTGSELTVSVSTTRSYYVAVTSTEGCTLPSRVETTVTINPIPSEPLVFDNETCGSGIVSLTAAGAPAGGEYRWYIESSGGTSFNSSSSYDADVSETTSYWVSVITPSGCEGPRNEIIATVNDLPTAPTGNPNSRCGIGSVSLSASSGETGSFNWYETEFSAASIFTGTNFNTPSISSTTSYWVEFTNSDGCISPRTEVVATVNEIVDDAIVPNVKRCGPGIVDIEASSDTPGSTFEWYDNQFGGSAIFEGETYSPSLSLSRNYYVLAISPEGCSADNRTPVTVTINPYPSSPSTVNGNVCGSGIVTLQASGAPAGGDYNWYENESGGIAIATGSSYNTPAISATTTYYVSIVNAEGCESTRSAATASVAGFPDAPGTTNFERCGSGDVNLVANSNVPDGIINWYQGNTGGASIATGASVTIDDITESTTYYASVTNPSGCESSRTPISVVINPIEPVDIGDNINLCVNASGYSLSADIVDVPSSEGFFVGPGTIDGVFYPGVAGVGNHKIDFVLKGTYECYSNGSRFITVISTQEGGSGLELSESEISSCYTGGLIDLKEYPNRNDGTWSSPNAPAGTINAGIFDPLISDVGDFTATYTTSINGCSVSQSMTVTILPAPATPVIGGPDATCEGETITLTVQNVASATTYEWYVDGESTPFATGNSIQREVNSDQTISVIGTNAFSCESISGTKTITSLSSDGNVVISTSPQTQVVSGEPVIFETNIQADSYEWSFTGDLSSKESRPVMVFNLPDTTIEVDLKLRYSTGCDVLYNFKDVIKVVDSNGMFNVEGNEDSFELEVKVNGASYELYPNPAEIESNFSFKSVANETISITVTDLKQTVVNKYTYDVSNNPTEKTVLPIPLDGLVPGLYVTKIEGRQFERPIVIVGLKK